MLLKCFDIAKGELLTAVSWKHHAEAHARAGSAALLALVHEAAVVAVASNLSGLRLTCDTVSANMVVFSYLARFFKKDL